MNLFISVGIDVGADFSWISIAVPNQQFIGNLTKSYITILVPLQLLFLK